MAEIIDANKFSRIGINRLAKKYPLIRLIAYKYLLFEFVKLIIYFIISKYPLK